MLFLFLLGQGVWIYHVRELKVKEFKMRAGYLLSEVAEEYIADEGLKYLAYGRDSSFRNGRLRENKDEKCFPVNHFYVFSEDKIHLVYDDLYENRELDVRRLDSLLRNALTERSMPPLVCWAISDRNTGHILLTCGKVSGSDKLIQAVPANLGCGFQHHLIASFELPFVFNAFMGILLVEVIFLLGFILSLLWQWHYIHTFWKTSEVKMMGAAHLEHELKKPIAILLNAVEDLMEAQIPFQMRDALPDLYDHWIAKDLLTYLNLAMGSRKRGEFLKIANRPNRYLSRDAFEEATVSFDALLEYYEEKDWMCQRIRKLEQDITTLTHLSPFGAVNYIRYAIGYEQYVKEYAAYRHLKEDDLISVLDELQEAAKSQKSIEGWFAHIEEYQQKMKEKQKQRAESAEGVTVSTLHSVKGLEYDKVYLLDVNEGVMPYQKAVLAEAIEEERRMFYVGMTRARKELTLCYVEERFEKKVEPSRFLDEVIQ